LRSFSGGSERLQESLGKTLHEEVFKKKFISALEPYKQSPLTNLVRKIKGETTKYIKEIPSSTLAIAILDELDKGTKSTTIDSIVSAGLKNLKHAAQRVDTELIQLKQDAQNNIEDWLDKVIKNGAEIYQRNARIVVIICALIVTVALNVDSIAIGKYFWEEPIARELAMAEADKNY